MFSADLQAVQSHQLADFLQRGLAEVLARQQFGFGDLGQIAERLDIHPGQAVAAANRQLEVGDWTAEEMLQLLLLLERLLS